MGPIAPPHRGALAALALVASLAQPALRAPAQEPAPQPRAEGPDPSRELQLFESTERDEDPLSLDRETGSDLDRAAQNLPEPAPAPLPSPHVGEALSAIDGVQEVAHRVGVTLADGLARVETRLTFASRAHHPAEVAYRLALPDGAVATGIARCDGEACEAAPPRLRPTPLQSLARGLSLETIVDARGHAAALRVWPLEANARVTLRVTYVAPAPLRGGRVRFVLPARGHDPRIAEADLRVNAPGLTELAPGASQRIDPTQPVTLTASLRDPAPATHTATAACGAQTCLRSYSARAPAPAVIAPTWLWIDASPSMEGPPRGRASAVVSALLALLPERTPLRAFAFAARAEPIATFGLDDAPVATLADATLRSLDAATRISSVVALTAGERARVRPRVLILSDGQLDRAPAEQRALAALKHGGAEPWLLHVGDAPPTLTSGVDVLDVATLADAAARDGRLEPLIDALRATVMPLRDGVRAGEQRVIERRPARAAPTAGASWLTYWLLRDRAPATFSLGGPPSRAVRAAIPFVSAPPKPAPADTGMPKESVLAMLRTQLVPAARACLRSDRKGRADYAVGLTFHALFAAREVSDVRIEGALPAPLRACLEAVVPRLRVPAFSGRIRVHYPIHTEREPEPPRIELEPELSRDLGRAFGPASGALP